MNRGEKLVILIMIIVLCLTSIALVWSAHDARVYTTKRFIAAVDKGFSCGVNGYDPCIQLDLPKKPEVKK